MKKRLMCATLAVALLFTNNVSCKAAGKTAIGLENNTPNGTSDAKAFVNGIKGQDSNYTVKYKAPSNVTNSDFFDKSYTIKYWSSHGNNSGCVWGTNSSADVNIFDQTFSWAGGNLEFVFLAACRQLDGSGSNPRKRYANAMIGNKAVRVICGYHEQAPAAKDKDVADKFIAYSKTGESVKSSWILANKYFQDQGYSTGVYCVLTHSGDVQYSRFPGFPGNTYTRPDASSTTILRFSQANPNGTTQPHNVVSTTNTIDIADTEIPNYALKATPVTLNVQDNMDMKVLREDTNLMMVGDEIGDEPVNMTEQEAIDKCTHALGKSISNYSSLDMDSSTISVTPIVMSEVNLDGGTETETTIAYDVTLKNTYNGIEILGDYMSGVVDDSSISYLAGNWNVMKKVNIPQTEEIVNCSDAYTKVKKYMTANDIKKNTLNSVTESKIAFVYNVNSGYYEPNWIFTTTDDSLTYEVNCLSGTIQVSE